MGLLGIQAGARILACDDEHHLLQLLETNLKRQGYVVETASDGREAMALLGQKPFDLAVVDLMMPDFDGYEVLKWIRTREETQAMRVVLMVPDVGAAFGDRMAEYRADLYVSKPFNS